MAEKDTYAEVSDLLKGMFKNQGNDDNAYASPVVQSQKFLPKPSPEPRKINVVQDQMEAQLKKNKQ